jgi:hypothetical protein
MKLPVSTLRLLAMKQYKNLQSQWRQAGQQNRRAFWYGKQINRGLSDRQKH